MNEFLKENWLQIVAPMVIVTIVVLILIAVQGDGNVGEHSYSLH